MDMVEIADLINNSCRTVAVLNDADELIGGTVIATMMEPGKLGLTLSTPYKTKSPYAKGGHEMLPKVLHRAVFDAIKDLLPDEGYDHSYHFIDNDFYVKIIFDKKSLAKSADYAQNAHNGYSLD